LLKKTLSIIQLYNFILHLHMDPGGKIYTIDEFRCWKVENLDDQRSDENKNEGGGYTCQLHESLIKLYFKQFSIFPLKF
jgi:hypothetical protein